MRRQIDEHTQQVHVAGIVPVAGQPLDFKFPWHDCMQPIGQNFLAIERAVLECATAGCKTIWIVCPAPMQPLLRYRLGNYVQDPFYWNLARKRKFPTEHEKLVPIYYVCAHPKDKNKRDSLVWSILYGAKVANKVSISFSKWLAPYRYYVSFPYGVFPSQFVMKHRRDISHGNSFFVTYNGQSIIDGEFLSCSIGDKELKILRKTFRDKATGVWRGANEGETPQSLNMVKLPIEERYSGRWLTVKDIFQELNITDSVKMNVPWYYNISTWNGLCTFLGSEHKMKRPIRKLLLPNSLWNGVGVEDEESEENIT